MKKSSPSTAVGWTVLRSDAALSNDLTDDPAETLLLVEWCESDIFWTEPRDLAMEDLRGLWQPPIANGPSERHQGTVNVAFVDTKVKSVIPQDLSPSDLRKMLTRDGRER